MSSAAGWPRVPIESVCEVVVDCVNRTAPVVDHETSYRMIRTTNVRQGRLDLSGAKYVDRATYERWTRRLVPQRDDVLLTREAPLGEVALLRSDEPVFLGQRIMHYRADRSKMNPRFLAYAMMSHEVQARIHATGSGSTVAHMRVEDAKTFAVPCPDLPMQERIADVLSAYDELFEGNLRRMALLEESVGLLYREWFERLRFPGYEWTPRVEGFPEHWSAGPLGRVAEVNPASVDRRHPPAAIRYVDISSLERGRFTPNGEIPWSEAPSRAQRLASDGDVLWAMVRPANRAYAIVDTPPEYLVVSTGIAVLSPRRVPTSYLYAATTTDHFVSHIASVATGASYPAAKPGDFEDARILLPAPEVLEAFDAFAGPRLRLIATLERQNAKLREARDYLLPRLMSGQLTA